MVPMVSGIKLNNAQICPENGADDELNQAYNHDPECVKFEMVGNGTGGRWDGVLTVYPRQPRNGIRVDIELDQTAWALGVINVVRSDTFNGKFQLKICRMTLATPEPLTKNVSSSLVDNQFVQVPAYQ